jgi:hypothetical protein
MPTNIWGELFSLVIFPFTLDIYLLKLSVYIGIYAYWKVIHFSFTYVCISLVWQF